MMPIWAHLGKGEGPTGGEGRGSLRPLLGPSRRREGGRVRAGDPPLAASSGSSLREGGTLLAALFAPSDWEPPPLP